MCAQVCAFCVRVLKLRTSIKLELCTHLHELAKLVARKCKCASLTKSGKKFPIFARWQALKNEVFKLKIEKKIKFEPQTGSSVLPMSNCND